MFVPGSMCMSSGTPNPWSMWRIDAKPAHVEQGASPPVHNLVSSRGSGDVPVSGRLQRVPCHSNDVWSCQTRPVFAPVAPAPGFPHLHRRQSCILLVWFRLLCLFWHCVQAGRAECGCMRNPGYLCSQIVPLATRESWEAANTGVQVTSQQLVDAAC